jgi:predicted dehydrogenase
MTINPGAIPQDHWVQDMQRGGGRIIGEACHFVDLLSFLADAPVISISAMMVGEGTTVRNDKMSILMNFGDGSIGTLNYFANGSESFPKETLEIFSEGRIIRMDNFRKTEGFGFSHFRKFKTFRQDKGHSAEIAAFIDSVSGKNPPLIAFPDIVNTTLATFAAMISAAENRTILLSAQFPDFQPLSRNRKPE